MDAVGTAVVRSAAQSWYGYGAWSAPFWFVGMEQGGDPEQRSYLAWKQLGGGELLDCRAHHLAIDDPLFRRWHEGVKPRTQPTWRGLIRILLSYKGTEANTDDVRAYQVEKWGRSNGETAVIELSALRARKCTDNIARFDFRDERVRTIRQRIVEFKPNFVVCYGLTCKSDYERVAATTFSDDGFARASGTIFALVKHPVSRGCRTEELIAFGRRLRNYASS